MKLNASQLSKRAKAADGVKSNWESLLRDCYEFALPMRNLYQTNTPGQQKMDRVFDSTAINSTQVFASTIQQGVTPPFQEFLDFLPGSDISKADKEKATKLFKELQTKFFEVVHHSNFDLAIAEFNLDLATGTACMLVMEGNDKQPINHIAVPNAQVSLDEGPFGGVDGVFRRHSKPTRILPQEWPDILPGPLADIKKKILEDPSQVSHLLEGTYYNPETDKYIYQVLIEGHGDANSTGASVGTSSGAGNGPAPVMIVEREMEEHPWIITRWIKVAGEVFGRGPLMFALPDIKTLNKTKEFVLQRASFDVAGMWEAVDDGVMNPDTVEIFPGAVIPVAASGNFRALTPSSNMDVSQFVMADMQIGVQRALLDESLPSEAGPVRSPTEILERIKKLQQKTGTPLARYMSEFLTPWANRVLGILFRKGILGDHFKIDGKMIKAKPTSPLAQQQSLDEIQAVLRWLEISQSLGQEAFVLGVKVEDVPDWIGTKFGVDPVLIRGKTERKDMQKLIGAAMAQQNGALDPAQQQAA
uniref:Portal protein n=1 Tax=uncultured marine virus TaxID=186617 RepID=A0A0F7L637_9VIRU|nr:hypothetical protein TMO_0053 [uncultured marine virus]